MLSSVASSQELGLVRSDDSFFNPAFSAHTQKIKSNIQYLNFKDSKYESSFEQGDVYRIGTDFLLTKGFKTDHTIYLGFNYLNSKYGPHDNQVGSLNFAYRMKADSSALIFGFSLGGKNEEYRTQLIDFTEVFVLGDNNNADVDLQHLMIQDQTNQRFQKQISVGSSFSTQISRKLGLITALSFHPTLGNSQLFNVRSIVEMKMQVKEFHSLNLLLFLRNQEGSTAYQSQLEFEYGTKDNKLGFVSSIGLRKFRADKFFPFLNFGMRFKRIEGTVTYFSGRQKFDLGSPKFNFGIFYNDISNHN